jgi:shikimate dehydrogenase
MAEQDRFHLAGVMGWPVMHSRSPMMHNYWMRQTGLNGTYVPLAIKPGSVEAALRGLHPLRFSGVNVTIPHKLNAMRVVDDLDPIARKIGAVSCIHVRDDGSLFGTNNDWRGFLGNLRETCPDWQPASGPATVIGAGGGARAVCHGLLDAGVAEIRLVNRTKAHAETVAAAIGGPITCVDWAERTESLLGVALVVNTTSCGMVGQPPLDLSLDALPSDAIATDIVYAPLQTPFLAAAAARGNRTCAGLGMLLHQGPPAWKLWFGLEPEVTEDLRRMLAESLSG